MKSVPKLIRRFVSILLVSMVLLLLLNVAVLWVVGSQQTASGSPYTMADEIGEALVKTEKGYVLGAGQSKALTQEGIWAILIDDETHAVIWNTDNLPRGIPLKYSLSDVSDLTLGYVRDYPTYVGDAENGIVVLGYPKKRYWKSMWPTWDYQFIKHLPQTILIAFLCNVLLILLIYLAATGKLVRSINPIIAGIKSLTAKEKIRVQEKGLLSELAFSINQAEELLENQERLLLKKEKARANWIAGVSHDIRTPLSIAMGYAGQLEENRGLSPEERRKAAIIVKQSERMRNLINDLNLASKLEYNMQPIQKEPINAIAIVRQEVVDFINLDIEGKYPVAWLTDDSLHACIVDADQDLIKRAVNNLMQNSVHHNEGGCTIYVSVEADAQNCHIHVSDNGVGVSDALLEQLNDATHYMVCDGNVSGQRHGLGLLIVKQILAAHHGNVRITHSQYGGFEVALSLPR